MSTTTMAAMGYWPSSQGLKARRKVLGSGFGARGSGFQVWDLRSRV